MVQVKDKFSKLFPKTFTFLQAYVKHKYGKKAEDVDVVIYILENELMGLGGQYNPFDKKITLNLDELVRSKRIRKKLSKNTELVGLFMDSQNSIKSTLVHEYQHFLQDLYGKEKTGKKISDFASVDTPSGIYLGRKDPWEDFFHIQLPLDFFKRFDNFREMYRVKSLFESLGSFREFIRGLQSLILSHRARSIKSKLYHFQPREIESQILEMVYNISKGKDLQSGAAEGWKFLGTIKKMRDNVKILKDGISEQEILKSKLSFWKSVKSGNFKGTYGKWKEIRGRIKILKESIYKHELELKMVPPILAEAERLGKELAKKRAKKK